MSADEAVLPIYVVGDSHVLPYRNMLFHDKWVGDLVLVHSKYIPGLSAHNIFDSATCEFHSELMQFLEYEGLVRAGKATHLSGEELDLAVAKASGKPLTTPIVLMTAGDIDIRLAIAPLLKDEYDFVPPFETAIPLSDKQLVPWDVLERAIDKQITSMLEGLSHLRACGFTRLYVQSVVPPTRNEARFFDLHGYSCPVAVRTKLVMAFNQKLAAGLKSIDVNYLDNWPKLVADDGLLRPELEVDGVHVPPKAARWYLEALIDHAVNFLWLATNYVRYEQYYKAASEAAHAASGVAASTEHV
jgi:lysophospholipase L1-like esterase